MQGFCSNNNLNWHRHEIFVQTCIPPEVPFFVRLDGWKFRKLAENVKAEKPFDKQFARCIVSSGKILYKTGFVPALIYVASDELNVLFLNTPPFHGRIEKINSILAGLVSSAFTLNLKKKFRKDFPISFDSRVTVLTNEEKIIEYLVWRQDNTWRNHNNTYAYWILSKEGYKPKEISKKLKGLKTMEIHEMVFKQGVNLAKTPSWQRRGILLYRAPYVKEVENCLIVRWKVKENWDLPLFREADGMALVKHIMKWAKRERGK